MIDNCMIDTVTILYSNVTFVLSLIGCNDILTKLNFQTIQLSNKQCTALIS